jgi:hypothetical protein
VFLHGPARQSSGGFTPPSREDEADVEKAVIIEKDIKAIYATMEARTRQVEAERLGISLARQWIQEEVMAKQAQHTPLQVLSAARRLLSTRRRLPSTSKLCGSSILQVFP